MIASLQHWTTFPVMNLECFCTEILILFPTKHTHSETRESNNESQGIRSRPLRNSETRTEKSAAHFGSLGNNRKSGESPLCGLFTSPCMLELLSIYLHLSSRLMPFRPLFPCVPLSRGTDNITLK